MTKHRLTPFTPRFLPTWLMFALMRLITLLPFALQLYIGRSLGFLLYYLLPKHRRVAEINLSLCYPDLNDSERTRMNRAHFDSVGISMIEIGMSWWASDRRLKKMVRVEGWEHLEQGLAAGKGVILLGGHYTNMEMAGRLFSLFHPLHVTYRDQGNAAFSYLLHRARDKHYVGHLPVNEVRPIIQALKGGGVVWLAPDQNWGKKKRVFADFFGVAAASNPGTARFSIITGAAVVPYRIIRRSDKAGYRLVLQPPLDEFPSGDLTADTARINAATETMIRMAPEQYMWFLKRFERRPKGEPHIYPRKLRIRQVQQRDHP